MKNRDQIKSAVIDVIVDAKLPKSVSANLTASDLGRIADAIIDHWAAERDAIISAPGHTPVWLRRPGTGSEQ